ncbi:unnamed protein product, partial [Owenia fusiformis]
MNPDRPRRACTLLSPGTPVTFSSPDLKGKRRRNDRKQTMKTLKRIPELIHEDFKYTDIDNSGILELGEDCKSLVFYTERVLTWISAFESFYKHKSMKATSKRIRYGLLITVRDHINIRICDSGIVSVQGDNLEDWKDNDYQLIRQSIEDLESSQSSIPLSGTVTSQIGTSDEESFDGFLPSEITPTIPSLKIDACEDSLAYFSDIDCSSSEVSQSILKQPVTLIVPETQQDLQNDSQINGKTVEIIPSQPATGDLHISQYTSSTPISTPSTAVHNTSSKPTETISQSGIKSIKETDLLRQNSKLRHKITQSEKKLEAMDRKYAQEIDRKNATILDLQNRLKISDKQRLDEIKITSATSAMKVQDLEKEILNYENKLSILTKELHGSKTDNETLYRKVNSLLKQVESETVSCSAPQSIINHNKDQHRSPRPHSSTESTSSNSSLNRTSPKNTHLPKQNRATPTKVNRTSPRNTYPDEQNRAPSTKPSPGQFTRTSNILTEAPPMPSVHIMYDSNGKKLTESMKRKSPQNISVTGSIYSGCTIDFATKSMQQGDLKQSTDFKFLGFGTNNVKTDDPQDMVYELKNLLLTASNK